MAAFNQRVLYRKNGVAHQCKKRPLAPGKALCDGLSVPDGYNTLGSFYNFQSTEMDKVNIEQKLALFSDYWSPKIIGELNGQQVKLAKFKGEFVWHKHNEEDELFMVIKGCLKMEFRDKTETINENEFIIVPRGTEHRPVADEEVSVLLFEPAATLNTGDKTNELTKISPDRI